MAYLGSLDPTKGLSAYAEELKKRFGITIEGEDKIVLPDGTKFDIIVNYGASNASWGWQPITGSSNSQNGGYPGVRGLGIDVNGTLGGDIWNDPALRLLQQFGQGRLNELNQPVNDPYRDKLFKMLEERIGQLQQYPWTESQESTLRTSATDQLQRDRQAAHQEIDRQLAARGHGQGSGTLVQAHQEVDRQFDQLVNAQQRGFDVYAINTMNQRRDQAVGLGGTMAQLSSGVRSEEEARRREAMAIAALFPEMQSQQLAQALAVLSGSPYTGPSIFGNMLQMANLFNQQNQYAGLMNQNFMGSLGQFLGGLFG